MTDLETATRAERAEELRAAVVKLERVVESAQVEADEAQEILDDENLSLCAAEETLREFNEETASMLEAEQERIETEAYPLFEPGGAA